jgi:ubiquinone/menaquinone biosynthesis C-methylase UbiE
VRRLAGSKELLDGPLDPDVLVGNLRDLARLNRWLGGSRLSWRAIQPLLRTKSRGEQLTVLDIGTGAGDIPRYLRRSSADHDPTLKITATDIRPEIVAIARNAAIYPAYDVKLAGPVGIDRADASFDVVHASMVLHHLEPPEAVELLKEMSRVAREAVIVNDLDRGRWWLACSVLLTRLLTRNAYTRNDAPLSVRRAYRPDELAALASRAGLREVARLWARPPYRYALVLRRE